MEETRVMRKQESNTVEHIDVVDIEIESACIGWQ